jgi:aminopeptidase N
MPVNPLACDSHQDLGRRIRRAFGAGLRLALLACVLSTMGAAGASPVDPADSGSARRAVRLAKQGSANLAGRTGARGGLSLAFAGRTPPLAAVDERNFDVEHYDLAIEVGDSTIAGTVRVEARALAGELSQVVLDLYDELSVSAVSSPTHGITASTHANNRLTLTLATPVAEADSFAVVVSYAGQPPKVEGEVAGWPFTFSTHGSADGGTLAPLIYTISCTYRAATWWPCKDVLTDKATVDVHVTVASGLVAVSNGVLTGVESLSGGRTAYHWSHRHPVATYLISLAISNYVTLEDTASIDIDGHPVTIPLYWFVYPEDADDAFVDFARVDEAIEFFSYVFGPYPYWDEKYAMAAVGFSGGMEHQTCTSIGARFIRGNGANEWIFIHELAHQWWGDGVGLADWRDVWLNEAFATYAEALWVEHTEGEAAYLDYVREFDAFPPPDGPDFQGTVYDPDPLFGSTPYEKGALILHMLRHIIGDDAFFQTLLAYGELGDGPGTVVTDDFVRLVEEISGQDLTDFFDQWLRYEGRPEYEWQAGYTSVASGYDVSVRIAQHQGMPDVYRMPIDVHVTTIAGEQVFVANNDQRSQEFMFHVPLRPRSIEFDPDDWVLKPILPAVSTQTVLLSPRPNPARGQSRISYVLPGETEVTLRVYDILGRSVRTLIDGRPQGFEQVCDWDGTDDHGNRVGAGLYFVELKTADYTSATRLMIVR